MTKQKVLISGGGVPGLALAVALRGLDLDVTLAEPSPPPAFDAIKDIPDGRTVAILDEHAQWLDRLGVWERVKPYAAPLKTMRIIDDSIPGRRKTAPHDFNARDAGKEAFMWNTPLSLLRAALWEALPARVTINGTDTEYDLILAADGRHSAWRDKAGITATFEDTGQAALAFAVELPEAHNNVSTEYQRVNGPLTFVPLPHPHQCSVVFVDTKETQERRLATNDIESALQDYGVNASIISKAALIPLAFMNVDRLYDTNIIVLAEAAHVIHPLGAQGLNLSLKDASVLSDLLQKSVELGLPVNDPLHVMEAYAKARRLDHAIKAVTVKTSLGFLKHGAVTGDIRRGVLSALDALPALKRILLKSA